MKKSLLISLIVLLSFCGRAEAGGRKPGPQFRCGVEWGYTSTVFESHHYNFLSAEGARVDVNEHSLIYNSNGQFLPYAGVAMGRWEADLTCGYIGVIQDRRVFPVSLRGTYFHNGCTHDGVKLFADGGVCLGRSLNDQRILMGKCGGGYRLMITERSAMDFMLSVHCVYDHPMDVYVAEYRYSVPDSDLLGSNRHYAGINFSISLNF